jgi:hypothetical protein
VRVPLKYGLYAYSQLLEDRLDQFTPAVIPKPSLFKVGQRVRYVFKPGDAFARHLPAKCATVTASACHTVSVRFDDDLSNEHDYSETAFKRDASCGRAPKPMKPQKPILGAAKKKPYYTKCFTQNDVCFAMTKGKRLLLLPKTEAQQLAKEIETKIRGKSIVRLIPYRDIWIDGRRVKGFGLSWANPKALRPQKTILGGIYRR